MTQVLQGAWKLKKKKEEKVENVSPVEPKELRREEKDWKWIQRPLKPRIQKENNI